MKVTLHLWLMSTQWKGGLTGWPMEGSRAVESTLEWKQSHSSRIRKT